jgi:hypothetical protein
MKREIIVVALILTWSDLKLDKFVGEEEQLKLCSVMGYLAWNKDRKEEFGFLVWFQE